MTCIQVNKIALSSNNDTRMQTLDCRKTLAYGTSKEIIDKNDKINKQKTFLKKHNIHFKW